MTFSPLVQDEDFEENPPDNGGMERRYCIRWVDQIRLQQRSANKKSFQVPADQVGIHRTNEVLDRFTTPLSKYQTWSNIPDNANVQELSINP
jgi:hypothetical protein